MGKLAAPRFRSRFGVGGILANFRVTAALEQELQALLTRAGKLLVGRTRGKSGREQEVALGRTS